MLRFALDFNDHDDPRPMREPAPSWLIAKYARRARPGQQPTPETTQGIADQQALRRIVSAKWHRQLELDFGVVVDAATGVYVYSDERRAAIEPRVLYVIATKPKRSYRRHAVKCARCSHEAAKGMRSCERHLEFDRNRDKAKREKAKAA